MTEEKGLSVSSACQVVRLSRAAYYRPGVNWAVRDAAVIAALNAALAERARWGFWKCYDRMRNLGHPWNHKRVHRVYCRCLPALCTRMKASLRIWPMVVGERIAWLLRCLGNGCLGSCIMPTLELKVLAQIVCVLIHV